MEIVLRSFQLSVEIASGPLFIQFISIKDWNTGESLTILSLAFGLAIS